MWVVMLAPLAFVLVMSFGINKLSTGAAQALFWVYAAVMGLSMSTIFLALTASSIATHFFAKIGRASCRDRVCKYVYISVVAGSLKKTTTATKPKKQNKHHYI